MGSKADYEARKAERQKRRAAMEVLDEPTSDIDLLDAMDRIATSFERIADALEAKGAARQ